MQTRANNSRDWDSIRAAYEAGTQSIRGVARAAGVSDTALRKRARKDGWAQPAHLKFAAQWSGGRRADPTPPPGDRPSRLSEILAQLSAADAAYIEAALESLRAAASRGRG